MAKNDPVEKVITTVGDSVIKGGIAVADAILGSIFGPAKPEPPKDDMVCVCHPRGKK
jgi:hypothetical protein